MASNTISHSTGAVIHGRHVANSNITNANANANINTNHGQGHTAAKRPAVSASSSTTTPAVPSSSSSSMASPSMVRPAVALQTHIPPPPETPPEDSDDDDFVLPVPIRVEETPVIAHVDLPPVIKRKVSSFTDPRPRKLSNVQASMLSDLSKKALSWHVIRPAEANLMYSLSRVNIKGKEISRAIMCLYFNTRSLSMESKSPRSPSSSIRSRATSILSDDGDDDDDIIGRIDIVENELVISSIALELLEEVTISPDNPLLLICRFSPLPPLSPQPIALPNLLGSPSPSSPVSSSAISPSQASRSFASMNAANNNNNNNTKLPNTSSSSSMVSANGNTRGVTGNSNSNNSTSNAPPLPPYRPTAAATAAQAAMASREKSGALQPSSSSSGASTSTSTPSSSSVMVPSLTRSLSSSQLPPSHFYFASQLDANDALLALQSYIPTRSLTFNFGQVCIHKGNAQARVNGHTFEPRYLRLVSNRLLCYRSNDSLLPITIVTLKNGDSDRAIDVTTISDSSVDWCLKPNASDSSLPAIDYLFRSDTAADRIKWVVAMNAERSCRQSCSDLLRQPTRTGDGMDAKDMKRPTRSQASARTIFHPSPTVATVAAAATVTHTALPHTGAKLVDPKVLLLAESPVISTRSADDMSVTSSPSSPSTPLSSANYDSRPSFKRQNSKLPQYKTFSASDMKKAATDGAKAINLSTINGTGNSNGNSNGGGNGNGSNSGQSPLSPTSTIPSSIAVPFSSVTNTARETMSMKEKLERMNTDQNVYFDFISQFRLSRVVTSTRVLSMDDWLKNTPNRLLSGRKKAARLIDAAMESFWAAMKRGTEVLRNCRLVCTEEESQSSTSQIGFAFPGFDSQVFDVGKLAVVSPWQFFAIDHMSFQEADWDGAIDSRCVAKELMQSSPDVTALFDRGLTKEAKAVMYESQCNVLHNICLAAYLKSHTSQSLSMKSIKLSAGDVIWWANVLTLFDDHLNRKHHEKWNGVGYIYNPSIPKIQSLLREFDTREEKKDNTNAMDTHWRLLFDPIRFLQFLRVLMNERINHLSDISQAINKYWDEFPPEKFPKSVTAKGVKALSSLVMLEMDDLKRLFLILPTMSAMDESVKAAVDKETTSVKSVVASKRKLLVSSSGSNGNSGAV